MTKTKVFALFLALLLMFTSFGVAYAAPAAPGNLKATVLGSSSIKLTWNSVSGAAKYEVYKGTSTTTMTLATTVTVTNATLSSLSSAATYYFKVRALPTSGTAGAFSSVINAKTLAGIAAPTGLKAASASSSQINLTWAAVSGATGYAVYRATSATGTYSKITIVTGASYHNTGLTANKAYYYKVRAVNSKGEGYYSSSATATTRPATPTGLKAASVTYNSIKLTWTATAGATKYIVYRCATSTGTFVKVGEATAASSPAYTNTGLTANTTYYYKVTAVNAGGEGAKSAAVSAKTLVAPPAAPTGLHGEPYDYYTVNLYWNTVTGAVKYHVYMATSATGTYSSVGYSVYTSCSVNGLQPGTAYYFKIATVGTSGEGTKSDFIGVQTVSAPPAPPAPGFKCIDSQAVGSQVTVFYQPTASVGVYRDYYSSDGIHWTMVDDATQLTYQGYFYNDVPYTSGSTVYLKFTAMNGPSESLGTYFTFAALAKPVNFSYQTNAHGYLSGNYGTITLNWNAVNGATRYRVMVRDDINHITTPLFDGFTGTNSITLNGLPVYISLNYYVLPYTGSMNGPIWGGTSASILGGY